MSNASVHTGRHFLQIPGPTNVPDRVLRAMDMPTIDHRGPEFAQLGFDVIEGSKKIFKTRNPVIIYPSSGTGAWEAAIVNTLSPGDKVLMVETGQFATLWRALAERILGAAGLCVWIEREDLMDAVTALSGSGPAYFFLLVEALEDAAVEQGLPRETARLLATQTAFGAGRMLREDGAAPATLRERVTSPKGTTQAALDSFAGDGFRAIVARAVAAAVQRGRELSAASGA